MPLPFTSKQGRLLLADFGLARYLPREPPTTFSASAAAGLSAATSALPTRAATAEPSAASLPLPPPGGAPQAGARVPPPDGTTVAEVCARQLALERARRAQREMDDLIDRAYYGDGDGADGAGGGAGGGAGEEQPAAAPAVQLGAPMNGHLQHVEASQGQAADHATANGGPFSVAARGSALPSPFAAHAGIAVAGAAAVAAAVCGGCRPGEGPGEEVPVMTHQVGARGCGGGGGQGLLLALQQPRSEAGSPGPLLQRVARLGTAAAVAPWLRSARVVAFWPVPGFTLAFEPADRHALVPAARAADGLPRVRDWRGHVGCGLRVRRDDAGPRVVQGERDEGCSNF